MFCVHLSRFMTHVALKLVFWKPEGSKWPELWVCAAAKVGSSSYSLNKVLVHWTGFSFHVQEDVKGQLILQFPAWIPYLLLKISARFPPTQSLAPLTGVSRVRKPRMNRAVTHSAQTEVENPSPTTARETLSDRVSGHFYLPFISIRKLCLSPRMWELSLWFSSIPSLIVRLYKFSCFLKKKKLRIPFLCQETQDLKALQMEAFVEKDKQVSWITHRLATFWWITYKFNSKEDFFTQKIKLTAGALLSFLTPPVTLKSVNTHNIKHGKSECIFMSPLPRIGSPSGWINHWFS